MPITKIKQRRIKKAIAVFMLLTIVNQILTPTVAYALTSGPTAPEATNFEPIDTTDMVNPLTGSFTYSMPLLEVPGPEGSYPLALSYHAGIQPNEEASWVGLGWSLNPGAIARNVNGYPDDWKESNGLTRSIWTGGSTETYTGGVGIGYGPASINIGLSFSQDTYQGYGIGWNLGAGLNLGGYTEGRFISSPFSIGAEIGVSAYGGAYTGVNLNYTRGIPVINGLASTTSIGVQTNFNSVSAGASESVNYKNTNGNSLLGASIGTSNMKPSFSVGGGSINSVNNPSADKVSTSSSGFSISIPLGLVSVKLGYNYTRYWSDNPNPFVANGTLYNRTSITDASVLKDNDDDNYQLFDPINTNMVDNPDPLEQLGGTYPNFDNYSVTAQGLGGNIRPYIFSSILYNENRVDNSDHSKDIFGQNLPSNVATKTKWQFRFINDFSNSYSQDHPWSEDQSYNFDSNPKYGNNDGDKGYDATTNRLEGTNHIEYFTNDELADQSPSSKARQRGFVDCDAAGFTRRTSTNQIGGTTVGKQIGGFMITNASGVTYHYALPVYSFGEMQRTENEPFANLTNRSVNKMFKYTDLTKNEAYAYTWYLTAITGPDYVSRGTTPGKLDPSDWGYWVKFDYGKWADGYRWRNPSEGTNDDPASPGTTRYSTGVKELYYLDAVETRTHTAIFEKEIRADSKSCTASNENTAYQPQALYYPQILSDHAIHPQSTLRLNNIYLFQNDQLPMSVDAIRQNSTAYNHIFTYSGGTERVHYGLNVIDKNDISAALKNNCLRKTAFNYDYSSAVGCPNSYDPGGVNTYVQNPWGLPPSPFELLGKLTLLSVDFQGRGGALITPPTKFQYDLDSDDPVNKDNISITRLQNYEQYLQAISPAIIQIQTPDKFKKGDILSFSTNGVKYYCTLLSPTDATNTTFNVYFLDKSPGALATNIPATLTKNPPYNKDAFDNWGFYKSDYGKSIISYPTSGLGARPDRGNGSPGSTPSGTPAPPVSNTDFVVKQRSTSVVSNSSTDVWSLRKVTSGIGSEININYEGDVYNKPVLSKNKSIFIDHNRGVAGPNNTFTFPVNPMGIDLNAAYKIGEKLHMVFLIKKITPPPMGTPGPSSTTFICKNADSYPTPAIITNIYSGTVERRGIYGEINEITIQVDPQMASDIAGNDIDANLTVNGNFFCGGGVRVKDMSVDDQAGNIKKTSYNYNMPGSVQDALNSSGVTSYEPLIFPIENLFTTFRDYANYQAEQTHLGTMTDPTDVIKQYRKDLYADNSQVLSIAREIPGPGVMYEYVTVTDNVILANGSIVPIEGKTTYQYEVFKPEMIGIYDYNNQETVPASGTIPFTNSGAIKVSLSIISKAKKNRSIKDYTSRIGNLKRMITYDNNGNKLTEKINHYLHDDLANTSFATQVNNYEPRLAAYNGVSYNNMGVIMERYGNARYLTDNVTLEIPATLKYKGKTVLMMSNKETYPTFQTGTTQIDYKNGTQMEQTNLAYDFYTGAVTKTLTKDSYGNRFVSQATSAYTFVQQMGLKTHDDNPGAIQHKQMLSQQGTNYTFSVNPNNTPIGVVSASAQVWSNGVPTLDPDGNITTTGQSNIFRMQSSFVWMPTGSSANNLSPYSSFVDFYAPNETLDPSWKKTSQITQYNVYSAALEAFDINNNYAATRMGYSNNKVLISGGPARYNEIAYAGVEDGLLSNGNFSSNISKGAGTIVTDSTKAHTGLGGLLVPPASSGFTYTVPLTGIDKKNYSVAVWVKPTSANAGQAQLYYQVGAGAVVQATTTLGKSAAGWYLLEMTIPSGAITGPGNLVIGCKNGSSADLYFDDFKFQPTTSSATAYVYDKKTGELTYIIGNNNLFTRFQYDEIGRLVRTYREVLGKTKTPIVSSTVYHYGKSTL